MPKKVLIILRHENSLQTADAFLQSHHLQTELIALDPVEQERDVDAAIAKIRQAIETRPDVIAIGTKVYDDIKSEKTDPPKKLIEFLNLLKNWGAKDIPICLTHLATMPENLKADIAACGLDFTYVEDDNLKRDGMSRFGPLILAALKMDA